MRYKISNSQIIHEQFGNEFVIVNLNSGSYYSTQDAGAAIWLLVGQNASQMDILRAIKLQFSGDAAEIDRETLSFLDLLIENELVAKDEDDLSGNDVPPAAPVCSSGPFSRPMLQKYSDLEELLALDPIHEVDEAGWPNAKNPQVHV